MRYTVIPFALLACGLLALEARGDSLREAFATPPPESRPETWFHLIGGNVDRDALTTDLEAVRSAGIGGIQLFHGSGQPWPGVSPQIQTLSPTWDGLIGHVGRETARVGLRFTMQNCPGWAMSGGPWITPERAMRHLIWSRTDVAGALAIDRALLRPQPSDESWRDYRDVAVLAFPTPEGDTGARLVPTRFRSNRPDVPWSALLAGTAASPVAIASGGEPVWLEVDFADDTVVRSIELPPTSQLTNRRVFDPAAAVRLEAVDGGRRHLLGERSIPRGNWQDRLPEIRLELAFADRPSRTFRITFLNQYPLSLDDLRLASGARTNDWRAQAGYVLRSLDHSAPPAQDPRAWVRPDAIVDLSDRMDASGRLEWNAPPGRWTVVRFGHVNTGVKNKPAPPEATGFECDKLSPLGAEQHFAGYIGRLTEPGAALEGGLLKGMLIDSWECYTQTWTPEMEAAFAARRGYSLRTWLPAIAGWVVDDHTTTERFLRDWRATISDLLVENYFGRLAALGRARGLQLSFETALGDVSPGDILQYYGQADIPMCEFWQPNDPHWGGFETKMIHPTVSAAHIYGKRVIAAEAFTHIADDGTQAWDEHPFALKHQADRHFALGVNHLVFHTYTHNPRRDLVPGTSFGSRIGTAFVRGQTWWRHMPAFTDYLARCHLMLQRGRPVADVLWYLGDTVDHKPRQDTPFPLGYTFDYLNADVLLNRLEVHDGVLRTPEGLEWRLLWLPEAQCGRLAPRTLARLEALVLAGAVVVGGPPVANPTLQGGREGDAAFARHVSAIWGQAPGARGDRRVGRGRVLWGDDIGTALKVLGVEEDLSGMHAATWCHRSDDGTEIYFVAAGRVDPLRANLRFRARGRPELWDPITGRTQPVVVFHRDENHTSIPIDLEAAGSVFVVFHPEEAVPAFVRVIHDGERWMDPMDPTRVDTGTPYPRFGLGKADPLQPWVEPGTPLGAIETADAGHRLVAWRNGTFALERPDGTTTRVVVERTREEALQEGWTLAFPEGWGAPMEIALPTVGPWSVLDAAEARAFSGTAVYRRTIRGERPRAGTRAELDLGRVADIAEVRLNGAHVGTRWAPPFRFDLTDHLTGGDDRLEIHVTNTWHNRLVFDAGLPEPARKTWTLSGPLPDELLLPAGVVGPLVLRVGEVVDLPAASPALWLLDAAILHRTRERLAAGDATLARAWARLHTTAVRHLALPPQSVTQKTVPAPSGDVRDYVSRAPYWWPDPAKPDGLPYVVDDGKVNPASQSEDVSDSPRLGRMAGAVDDLTLAYAFSGEERFAAKAAELLRAWFITPSTRMNPHLNYGQGVPGRDTGRGFGIIDTVRLMVVPDAANLIRGSAHWSAADDRTLRAWFGAYADWLVESAFGRAEAATRNNHATWYDAQLALFSLHAGRPDVARRVLSDVALTRIATQIEPDGRQPHELRRTKSFNYSRMNLQGFLTLARLGRHVGVDLAGFATEDGRSIRVAARFLLGYAAPGREWPFPQIGGFTRHQLFSTALHAGQVFNESEWLELASELGAETGGDERLLLTWGLEPRTLNGSTHVLLK